MLQGDLFSFVTYFEEWAQSHPDLKFFLFGSIERGAEYARGFDDFKYPYAWLEQPSIIPEDNEAGNTNDVFHFGISVLIKAPLDDRRAQILAQHQSILILNSLRKKIKHDLHQGTIECEVNKMRMDPILSVKNESEYGYRLEMQLGFNVNEYVC